MQKDIIEKAESKLSMLNLSSVKRAQYAYRWKENFETVKMHSYSITFFVEIR